MKTPLVIYWSRRDFRLSDNRALLGAIEQSQTSGAPLVPLFIVERYMATAEPREQFGYPSRWFLSEALPHFAEQFPFFLFADGIAHTVILSLAKHYAITIHVNEDVHPDFYRQVEKIRSSTVTIKVYADMLTIPKETRTKTGSIYSIFTPFKTAVWQSFVQTKPAPRAHPEKATTPSKEVQQSLTHTFGTTAPTSTELHSAFSKNRTLLIGSHTLDLAAYTEKPDLTEWYTSESAAHAYFAAYLKEGMLDAYKTDRDALSLDTKKTRVGAVTLTGANSRMSLALVWGLLSARTLVSMIEEHYRTSFVHPPLGTTKQGAVHFISELIWREFYKYLFFHRSDLFHTEFQKKFQGTIAWVEDKTALKRFEAWIQGETGYPLVDAAMKQLAKTGYMHNRARMVVASVLTKNFGVDWRWGQEYFRAALIDLDESSNNGGWQWAASVGADPKPIRIFNPLLQAETHDPKQEYQKHWLGEAYFAQPPSEIVPHKDARAEALKRYHL